MNQHLQLKLWNFETGEMQLGKHLFENRGGNRWQCNQIYRWSHPRTRHAHAQRHQSCLSHVRHVTWKLLNNQHLCKKTSFWFLPLRRFSYVRSVLIYSRQDDEISCAGVFLCFGSRWVYFHFSFKFSSRVFDRARNCVHYVRELRTG